MSTINGEKDTGQDSASKRERTRRGRRRQGPSQQGVTFLSNQIRSMNDIGWSNEIFRAVARSSLSR